MRSSTVGRKGGGPCIKTSRKARELGLAEIYTTQLIARSRRIAHPSGEELERRLVEDPGAIAHKELSVINGIAADNIAR